MKAPTSETTDPFPGDWIVLGTAQLTRSYGATSLHQRQNIDEEATSILDAAVHAGFKKIDTAPSYGDAETKIGSTATIHDCRIQTKWQQSLGTSVTSQLESSLQRLRRKNVWAYFMHDPIGLNRQTLASALNELDDLKNQGRIDKIGFSVYEPWELEEVLNLGLRDGVIQFPLSPVMNKFRDNSLLSDARKLGFTLQARSVYMQGMLVSRSPLARERDFPAIERARTMISAHAEAWSISPNSLVVHLVRSLQIADEGLVGVAHRDELELLTINVGFSGQDIDHLSRCLLEVSLSSEEQNPMSW